MKRSEMRRAAREKSKASKIYHLTEGQINDMKRDITEKAIGAAFKMTLAIPVMVLHDKYSLLTRKEVDGKCREERFAEYCLDLMDSVLNRDDLLTLDDIKACLEEETGMRFE